ncbi:phosphoglycerate mutase [Shewanella sp. OPT22]|nr:phosphoglycerate mutase [Shewanella sp. OPT22]
MKNARLILLRHGECEGGQILRGLTNVLLSEKGEQQMWDAVSRFDAKALMVYTSPLKRCFHFAEKYDDQGIVMPSLAEFDFGDWDGKAFKTIFEQEPEAFSAFWDDPWKTPPPNGEPMEVFEMRVTGAITQIIDDLLANTEEVVEDLQPTALVITHAGVIRQVMALALHLEKGHSLYREFDLPYAAVVEINVIEDDHGRRHLRLQWPNSH